MSKSTAPKSELACKQARKQAADFLQCALTLSLELSERYGCDFDFVTVLVLQIPKGSEKVFDQIFDEVSKLARETADDLFWDLCWTGQKEGKKALKALVTRWIKALLTGKKMRSRAHQWERELRLRANERSQND